MSEKSGAAGESRRVFKAALLVRELRQSSTANDGVRGGELGENCV